MNPQGAPCKIMPMFNFVKLDLITILRCNSGLFLNEIFRIDPEFLKRG